MDDSKANNRHSAVSRSYGGDYFGWIEDTAYAIEEGRFSEIDRSALADEVRDWGKSERREFRSALEVLLMHMLKMRYQPEKQTRGWRASIEVQRDQVAEFLEESPSLRPGLSQLLRDAYRWARIRAANETDLDIDVFPEACLWTTAEVLAATGA